MDSSATSFGIIVIERSFNLIIFTHTHTGPDAGARQRLLPNKSSLERNDENGNYEKVERAEWTISWPCLDKFVVCEIFFCSRIKQPKFYGALIN